MEKEMVDALAAGTLEIQVNIRKKEAVFSDVYIKKIDTLSENTLLISIQPPLEDALYGIEKRDIIVEFKTENGSTEISKTLVLGTATQRLDLRVYKAPGTLAYIRNGVLWFFVCSIVFALAIPLIKKYRFKKHNVKKYKQVTAEDKAELDPFTFEAFEEKDDVIVIDEDIMLLRSWKRLNVLKEEDRIEELSNFFEKGEKSNLFKPVTEVEKRINRTWFGMIGAYTGWLLYVLLMHFNIEGYKAALSYVFDSTSKQLSSAVYTDSILAITLGFGISIAFSIADRLYGNHDFSIKTLYRSVLGVIILLSFFLLQFLINIYLINNSFFGSLITWICIGTGIALSFGSFKTKKKKTLTTAGILSLAGFITHQLCSMKIFIDVMDEESKLLISLLTIGSILGYLTHVESTAYRVALREENDNTSEEDKNLMIQPAG